MQEKFKYVLNGEITYYTRDELKEYYTKLLKNSKVYFEEDIEEDIDELIKKIQKYDGDPYGYLSGENRIVHHQLEARGFLMVIH